MATTVLQKGYVFISPVSSVLNMGIGNISSAQWGTILKVNDLCENYAIGDNVFFNNQTAILLVQTNKENHNTYFLVKEEDIFYKQNT